MKTYQAIFSKIIKHRYLQKDPDIISDYLYTVISEDSCHCFFGYYDISPFNSSSNLLLNISTDGRSSRANINVYNLETNSNTFIVSTGVWNWQQGCRLRWMPGYNDRIVFNDIEDHHYCCRIVDITRKKILNSISLPIYDINYDGSLGLSLNFSRLGTKRPGYGYTNFEYKEEKLYEEGIDLVSMKTGDSKRIIMYKDILKLLSNPKEISNYYINHLSFSPSGSSFLFFFLDSSTPRHEAFMLVYEMSKGEIIPLEIHDKVSHYVWKNDEEIIATVYDDDMNCNYYIYSIKHRERTLYNNIIKDGHPSIYSKERILTDTYPNSNAYQSLFITDQETNEQLIAQIYSDPRIRGEKRTDLHPRLNKDKSLVCVDLNKKGHREIGVFNLNSRNK